MENAAPALAPGAAPSLFDVLPQQTPPLASPPENLVPSPDAERLKNKPLALEWLWVPISELKNRPLSSIGRKIAEFIEKAGAASR